MDTLNTILDKVNDKIKNTPIFFITNDAERALGLEKLLINYHIICIDRNDIVDYMQHDKIKIFSLEKELNKINVIYRNSNRLLNHTLIQNYIKNYTQNSSAYLMFFKIAPNIERTAEKLGLKLLNTSSDLNRKYELKLSQYESIKNLNINIPDTIISKLKDTNYNEIKSKLGNSFIIQFNRGHTGGGTIIIDEEHELEDLKSKFPERTVKLVKYIHGPSFTLNGCITKYGIYWGGLSYQITGIEECTSERLATVGNDWYYCSKLDDKIKNQIDNIVSKVGEEMAKNKFIGMFGLDIVVEQASNKAYLIEINARQPASIPMFSKIQIINKEIPLNLLAICEFLEIEYTIDQKEYNYSASKPFEYAQLFIRNKFPNIATLIGGVKPGAYRLLGDNATYNWDKGSPKLKPNVILLDDNNDLSLVLEEESYAIDDIKKGGLIILCSKEGKLINSNAEVARIQSMQSLLDKDGQLKTWTKNVINGLNKYIILKELEND
jgi:hypothetical protein